MTSTKTTHVYTQMSQLTLCVSDTCVSDTCVLIILVQCENHLADTDFNELGKIQAYS